MRTAVRVTAFAAALAASFGAAYAVGGVMDPVTSRAGQPRHPAHESGAPSGQPHGEQSGGHAPGGLQVSEGGYTLDLETPRIEAGKRTHLRFAVRDGEGRAVKAFKRVHDKELHLILASHDLGTYRHVHPARAADGTWSVPVDLPEAGDYRAFADFAPARKGADDLTLGADLSVSGDYGPGALPRPERTATVDGYDVRLEGRLRPGAAEELRFEVSKDGREVTDLQPYLGAYGHLVALRSGDLAYLHVHPKGEPGHGRTKSGPGISFSAEAPSGGDYRLFLDFKHEGKVRTAAFTVPAGPDGAAPAPSEHEGGDGHGH